MKGLSHVCDYLQAHLGRCVNAGLMLEGQLGSPSLDEENPSDDQLESGRQF